ncbi:MAG: TVP38/TMEM64 family protein [Candidatus Electrothrix sp. GW3-4]|uniref:TVP38/TMEM64 family protein n=1 Tax=Candidatus Electrothrix sp. GW3-4 TaxID=3126740 RepID=UPI0030D234D5
MIISPATKPPQDKKIHGRVTLLLIIATLAVLFIVFDGQQYLSLASLKSSRQILQDFYREHQLLTIAGYMLLYILITALSLPGALIMSLGGGALFGLWLGFLLVSFASTIGATLAFLGARFLFRDTIQQRFGEKLAAINKGIEQDGAFYLFSLRLVPVFPFFIINLIMGLTSIRTRVFYLVSQIGMVPGTLVYVNAGTQLGKIESAGGILSPGLLFSFALLGLFPLLAKTVIETIRKKSNKRKT